MKIFIGQVISKKMQKTATVLVERVIVHPIYKKRSKRARKYHVHDTFDVAVGQTVKFVASKPYSKSKRWKIIEVLAKQGKSAKKKASGGKKVLSIRKKRKK